MRNVPMVMRRFLARFLLHAAPKGAPVRKPMTFEKILSLLSVCGGLDTKRF